MTAKEMVDYFDLLFQERQSNQSGSFDNNEKIKLLNIAQTGYIKNRFNKFQQDQRMTDEIRTLIRRNYTTGVYALSPGSVTGYQEEANGFFINLPHNYMHLINLRAQTRTLDDIQCEDNFVTIDNCTNQEGAEYIAAVPFTAPIQALCSTNQLDLQIIFGDAVDDQGATVTAPIFDYAQFTRARGYTPAAKLRTEQDKYFLINLILEYLNRYNSFSELLNANVMSGGVSTLPSTGINDIESNNNDNYFQVYWERYNDKYFENSFVFVSKNKTDVSVAAASSGYESDAIYNDDLSPLGITVDIQSNGTSILTDANYLNLPNLPRFRQLTRCITEMDITDVEPEDVIVYNAPVRVENGSNIYFTLNSYVGKTTAKDPYATFGNDMIYLFTNGQFVYDSVKIDYIRTPRPISLDFNMNSELPRDVHHEIVDRAVTLALETTSNYNRLQSKISETQYREGRQ